MENNDTSNPYSPTKSQPMRAGLPHGFIGDNEREYGENSIYTADEFGNTPVSELNREYLEDSKDDTQMAMPMGGDELHHRAANELTAKVQTMAGVELMPWQRAYLNAAVEAKPASLPVKLIPTRRHV